MIDIGFNLCFSQDMDKNLLDGFWILDINWIFNDTGLCLYQSTSDTKVVWPGMLDNGAFALIFYYGYYCGDRTLP